MVIYGCPVLLSTNGKNLKQNVKALIKPIHPSDGLQCSWNEIKKIYGEDVLPSEKTDVSIELLDDVLIINATTDIGVEFSSKINGSRKSKDSLIQGVVMSWDDFKSHIAKMSKAKYLFRGQQKPWELRTAFHRRGRYLMSRFTGEDVRQLHRRLSAITNHYFDLSVAEENGAFFNLMQHHGYPTPLLDWSHSPYVAAFFAFRDWPIRYTGDGSVRVYVFNEKAWCRDYPQIQNLDPAFLHLSVNEFIAINNQRLVPQQSVTTVTNIDDIEAYIVDCESSSDSRYLEAIDIPANEREEAMRDLKFMGITAGSMFPSIDGVCEELRERNFDK